MNARRELSDLGGSVFGMPEVASITHQVAAVGDLIDEVLRSVASMPGPDPEMDPRAQTDDRLRELLVGLERVRHSAEAAQADVMVALGFEARRLDVAEYAATGMPARSHEEFVPDEMGVLLACTSAAAGRRYATAINAAEHAELGRRWRAGDIDGRKVQVITDEVRCLSDPEVTGTNGAQEIARVVSELTDAAAEHARSHTWSQTRQWLRRRVVDIAPEVTERRIRRAEADRRVEITPSDDGMSELWAVLPSIRAGEIQQALTTAAHQLGADDARTMDQRRADLLVDWLLGTSHAPAVHLHLVVNGDDAVNAAARDAINSSTHRAGDRAGSVASAAALGESASWLPGVGPLTPRQTSELLAAARSTTLHVPPDTRPQQGYRPSAALERAVRVRDVTCRFPGCRRAALGRGTGTDIDHTVSWPVGATVPSNLAVLCRRHHRLKHSAGWRVALNPDATMTWTTPSGRKYTSEPWHHPGPPATGFVSHDPVLGSVLHRVDLLADDPDPPRRE